MTICSRTAEPGRGWSLSYGNSFETDKGKLGVILAANHDRDFQIVTDREINRGAKLFNNQFDLTQTQRQDVYESEIAWGLLGNLAWQPNENHEVGLAVVKYVSARDQVKVGRRGASSEAGNIADPRDGLPGIPEEYLGSVGRVYTGFDEIGYLYRSQETVQLDGTHNFGLLFRLFSY